jgi:two-component system sensor histidine kinase ChiS
VIKCALFYLFCSLFVIPAAAQSVKDGQADFLQCDFEKDGTLELSGEWEFSYGRLLDPGMLDSFPPPALIRVPGSWHRQGNFPVQGYATYRTKVILPPGSHNLSLYFPIINSSAKIWINGILEEEKGSVGTDKDHYTPGLTGTIVSLPEGVSTLDVVVQVANYSYFEGGIGGVPRIGRTSTILGQINRRYGIENFFAGSLIAMFLYQLILYFLFERGKPYLWLSLICLGVALRALITHGGSFLLPNLFPLVDWEYWKKLEFGSVYAIVAIFPLYIYHLFKDYSPRKPIIFFVGVALILCSVVIVTSQPFYGLLLEVCHVSLLLGFIYAVYSVGKAWSGGESDARIILFGVLAAFPFILTEILKNSILLHVDVPFMYLVEMGVLLFLLFQVYLLANHYSKSYKKLELSNLDLEKVVADRTRQLTTANTVKDRLLTVISHDVKSPLNSLRGILRIYNSGAISQEEFGKYALRIEDDLSKTGLLVENVLYWTTSQLKGIKIRKELLDVATVIEENLFLFETVTANKKLVIRHDAPKGMKITADKNILNLVLRNLLANAIKYSFEGGEIQVNVGLENRMLSMLVKDSGVGLDESTMQAVLAQAGATTLSGTGNEKGTGMGLALCREFVLKAGGQMSVESSLGKGSTFSILLPAD